MQSITVNAPAKLNLFLHVTGKRADGYHLLESMVAFAAFGDTVECALADTLSLQVRGPFAAALGDIRDNLVFRAARLLQAISGTKKAARIVLDKQLPVASGMGGGSADAAAALIGLSRLWGIADVALLQRAARELGSDVPVCLHMTPALMRGVGEEIIPLSWKADVWVVLANPLESLLTADVFRHFSGVFSPSVTVPPAVDSFAALMAVLEFTRNDLETAAIRRLPVIADILRVLSALPDCRLARMSGSGATCFGLFDSEDAAQRGWQALRAEKPKWWSVMSRL